MIKHLLTLFLIGLIINSSYSQCGPITYGTSKLNGTINGSNCTYTISLQAAKISGNPSVSFEYKCGSGGTYTLTGCAQNLTTSLVTYISDPFTCPCSQTVFAQYAGHNSSNCKDPDCAGTTTVGTNLAIGLSNFDIENSANKKQICLSWSVANPDPSGIFAVETSEDGISFKNSGTYSHQQTYKSNTSYAVCMENKLANTYYRLKVIDPSGAITLSPVRKINFSNTSLSVSVDRNHQRINVFGLDRHDAAIPYDIMNMYGQTISKGQLKNTSIELPSISNGMYILRLNLPSKEVPLKWIY